MKSPRLGTAWILALGAIGGTLAPGAARAALSCSFPTPATWTCTESVTLAAPTLTDFTASLTLDKWSTSLPGFTPATQIYALSSVNWSVGGLFAITAGSITNNGGSTANFTVNTSSRFSFSPGAGAPPDFTPSPDPVGTAPISFIIGLPSGGSATVNLSSVQVGPTTGSASVLSNWIGSGTFIEQVTTHTSLSISSSAPFSASLSSTGRPGITLTYAGTVAAIPEPAAAALMGAGLLGLLGTARRRA